jgi:phosphoheptose isomerase
LIVFAIEIMKPAPGAGPLNSGPEERKGKPMVQEETAGFARLVERYPDLADCLPTIVAATRAIEACYRNGGKVLVCGNGGSAADSEHIVGELMKGFNLPRRVPTDLRSNLVDRFGPDGAYLADHLQGALPAISLVSQTALLTACANDLAADMAFAQQVYGYGRAGDLLIGISTSGNARNVIHALQLGVALGLRTVGLTGKDGGAMLQFCAVSVRVPADRTADVQERHLAIYHTICSVIEEVFFA